MTENIAILEKDTLKPQVSSLTSLALSFRIKDNKSMSDGMNLLVKIKEMSKTIEEKRISITKPINESLKNINSMFKELSIPLSNGEGNLKKEISTFQMEQERLRQIEQEKLRQLALEEERKQKARLDEQERIAREKADELRRLAEEEENEKEKQKMLLKAEKLEEKADGKLEQQESIFVPMPILAPIEKTTKNGNGGSITNKKVWKARIVNRSKIPLLNPDGTETGYWDLNMKAINAMATAKGKGLNVSIPGVEFYEDTEISVRV